MSTSGHLNDDEADHLKEALGVGPDDLRRDLEDALKMRTGSKQFRGGLRREPQPRWQEPAPPPEPGKDLRVQMREVAYEALVTYLANRPTEWWAQPMPAIEKEMFAVARAIAYADDLLSERE
jgi:hypothetical protein